MDFILLKDRSDDVTSTIQLSYIASHHNTSWQHPCEDIFLKD